MSQLSFNRYKDWLCSKKTSRWFKVLNRIIGSLKLVNKQKNFIMCVCNVTAGSGTVWWIKCHNLCYMEKKAYNQFRALSSLRVLNF